MFLSKAPTVNVNGSTLKRFHFFSIVNIEGMSFVQVAERQHKEQGTCLN